MDENYVFCFVTLCSFTFACVTLYFMYLMERGDK